MDEKRQSNPNTKYSRPQPQSPGYEGNPTYQNNLHSYGQQKQWNYEGLNGYAQQNKIANRQDGSNKTESLDSPSFTENKSSGYGKQVSNPNMPSTGDKSPYAGSQDTTYQYNPYGGSTYNKNTNQPAPLEKNKGLLQEQNKEIVTTMDNTPESKKTVAESIKREALNAETKPAAAKTDYLSSQFSQGGFQFNPSSAEDKASAYQKNTVEKNSSQQNAYAQPQYDQPQYGQPQYGQPQYGQPQSAQPQYGQPQYNQPQYNQPQYGQNNGYQNGEYLQNGYSGMQNQQYATNGYNNVYTFNNQKKSRKPIIIGAVIGGIAALVILIVILVNVFGASNSPEGVLNKFEHAVLSNDIDELIKCCDEDLQEQYNAYIAWYGDNLAEEIFGDNQYEKLEVIDEYDGEDYYTYSCKLISDDGDYDYVEVKMEKNDDGDWVITTIY